jgi:hypothetical protein
VLIVSRAADSIGKRNEGSNCGAENCLDFEKQQLPKVARALFAITPEQGAQTREATAEGRQRREGAELQPLTKLVANTTAIAPVLELCKRERCEKDDFSAL